MNTQSLVLLVLGTIGTVLVGFGVLTAEQNETIQDFIPEAVGVVLQLIAILKSLGLVKVTEQKMELLKLKQAQEVQALKSELMALKK